MSRSKLGPLPDSVFENDLQVPDMKAVYARYPADYKQRRDKLIAKMKADRAKAAKRKK